MSTVIHRYAPHERQLLDAQRLQQRRMDACAIQHDVPSSRGAGGGPFAQPQLRASSATSNGHSQRRRHQQPMDYNRMNCDLIREVAARNNTEREARKLAAMSTQLADDALRAQWAHHRGTAGVDGLTGQSPRRAHMVRDMSADAAAQEAQEQRDYEQRSKIPEYLVRRRAEQDRDRRAASQAQAVAESERNFPKGQEPLNPDVAERTREFLELRVSELETALRLLPFRAECSQLGRRRKADLENQLRDTEAALAKFNFPVVFVKASHPQPVLVAQPTTKVSMGASVPTSSSKRRY